VSYLVYCILNGGRGPARPSIMGVRHQTVWVLEGDGLCAAVSETGAELDAEIAATEIANDVSALRLEHLVPYAKVVEAFNRGETVVPMRYGCRFKSVAEVRTWLRERAGQYHALLARLDGCVEMGVRALLMEAAGLRDDDDLRRDGAAGLIPAPVAASSRGAAYLAARRSHFAITERAERTAQTVRDALSGRFREAMVETRGTGASAMVSLYFLVERGALGGFRAAFGRIGAAAETLMLTGPWPPYNFVCGAAAGAGGNSGPSPLKSIALKSIAMRPFAMRSIG